MRRIPLVWLLAALLLANIWLALNASEARFTWLVVHHSASDRDNYHSIREHHLAREMSEAAYHLILSNGSTDIPSGHLEPTTRFRHLTPAAATKGVDANLRGLHVCIIGNYEEGPLPDKMIPPLAHALTALGETFDLGPEDLLLHRDVNNTACPGKFITKELLAKWMRERADECPETIARQQGEAISTASLSRVGYPGALIGMHLGVTMGLLCIWWGGNRLLRRRVRKNRYI